MLGRIAVKKYRPQKVADGEQGFTRTLGSYEVLRAKTFKVHENEGTMVVPAVEDIRVGDVIVTEGL